MHCYTLHSNQSLIEGIPVVEFHIEADMYAWSISVGKRAEMGVFARQLYPKFKTDKMHLDMAGNWTMLEIFPSYSEALVLIKNQSPRDGAWAFEKDLGVEILSEGYVPLIRKGTQAPGFEYLLEMSVGSRVKLAIAGRPVGPHKKFYLESTLSGIKIIPDDSPGLIGKMPDHLPFPGDIMDNQWQK